MDAAIRKKTLSVVFVYSGEFAERVIRNLINDPSFCKPCGLYCDSCKYGSYSFVRNVKAAIELTSPRELPAFIDNPQDHLPRKIPASDLCVASGLHKDLLLELPVQLRRSDIRGLIVPIEDFQEVPSGLKKQVEEKCQELGIEVAFPKPFCSLEPSRDKLLVTRFVECFRVGRPIFEISIGNSSGREIVEYARTVRSAPCGSTWYIAKKLVGTQTRRNILYDVIAKAHHSYPCTATMNVDPDAKEPILHMGGFIVREQVEKALSSCAETLQESRRKAKHVRNVKRC
jgi:hypothetical protein